MIRNIEEKFEIEVKRFYLPFTKTLKCPFCGEDVTLDLSDNYLSYPTLNEFEPVPLYCDSCDNEPGVRVKLTMNIEVTDIEKE